MPVLNGLETTKRIRERGFNVKILILSMHNEAAIIKESKAIGANGYLLKNSSQKELINAIEQVLTGSEFYEAIPENAVNGNAMLHQKTGLKDEVLLIELTDREKEILKFVAEGLSNKEIGEELFISHRTVDTHRTNLMKKLNIHNVAGLIRFAIKSGLVS